MNFRPVAAILVLPLLASCGSSSSSASAAPTILVQPEDRSVAPGQSTTFTVQVDAGGTATAYKWYWNGVGIPDATGPTFATRPAEVSDNGSLYKVEVTSAYGTTASRTALLTVSPAPRAPKPGDLRFQGVGAAPYRIPVLFNGLCWSLEVGYPNAVGTPLSLSSGSSGDAGCPYYMYEVYSTPTSVPKSDLRVTALSSVAALQACLAEVGMNGSVVSSLDVQDGADGFALARATPGSGTFRQVVHSLPPSDLSDWAASEGTSGRVITAVAPHAGGILVLSYEWNSDLSETFETTVARSTMVSLVSDASALSSTGYIITAFGRDGTGGFILVGTRVRGDSMARPFATTSSVYAPQDLIARGFAMVGYVWDGATSRWTWIAQQ